MSVSVSAQTCWTRPPSQCGQRSHAPSNSSLHSAIESRPSAQEFHPDNSRHLRMFFTQSSCKKPVTTFLTSPTSSLRTLATRTSPSCSTRTPVSQTLLSTQLMKPQPAKIHGAWSYLLFEVLCVALRSQASLRSRSALYTSIMLWPRNVTPPLTYLDAYMGTCSSTTSISLAVVFADPEFSAPGNSFLWGLGALEEANRECTGFLIMPKRPCEWRGDSHGCYKFNNADLALGPRDSSAHCPVFLHLRTTNLPGPDSITRSEQAQQRRLERKATKHERRQCRRRLAQPSAP